MVKTAGFTQDTTDDSCTYMVGACGLRKVKIGKSTKRVKKRLRQLQSSCPVELGVLCVIPANFEKSIHEFLSADRVRGEWFSMSDSLASLIGDVRSCHLPSPQDNLLSDAIFSYLTGRPYGELPCILASCYVLSPRHGIVWEDWK
jgi:hypothetical protein